MNDNNFWFWLEATSNLAQLASYDILIQQNSEIIRLLKGENDARD